jgi:hypothetical protein
LLPFQYPTPLQFTTQRAERIRRYIASLPQNVRHSCLIGLVSARETSLLFCVKTAVKFCGIKSFLPSAAAFGGHLQRLLQKLLDLFVQASVL